MIQIYYSWVEYIAYTDIHNKGNIIVVMKL